MSRWWWLAILLVPGGCVLAPIVVLVRRARERNRVVRPPIEVVDLVAAREHLRVDDEWWQP